MPEQQQGALGSDRTNRGDCCCGIFAQHEPVDKQGSDSSSSLYVGLYVDVRRLSGAYVPPPLLCHARCSRGQQIFTWGIAAVRHVHLAFVAMCGHDRRYQCAKPVLHMARPVLLLSLVYDVRAVPQATLVLPAVTCGRLLAMHGY